MDLVGGQIGCRGAADEELVVLHAILESGDAGLCAAGGDIADLEETGEPGVGGQHLFGRDGEHVLLDALLLGGRGWRPETS